MNSDHEMRIRRLEEDYKRLVKVNQELRDRIAQLQDAQLVFRGSAHA